MRGIIVIIILFGISVTTPVICKSITDKLGDSLGEKDKSKIQPVPLKEVIEKQQNEGKPVNSTIKKEVVQYDKKSNIKSNTGTKNHINEYKIKKIETGQTNTHKGRINTSRTVILEWIIIKPIKNLAKLIMNFLKAPQKAIEKILNLVGIKKKQPPKPKGEKNESGIGLVPGTKWCGPGNDAKNISDVGSFAATDSCCRQHDNCPKALPAGKSGYGLKNTGVFTRSDCKCDSEFYNCLKNANTAVSNKVGTAYFTVLKPQCFKKVDCQKVVCRNGKNTGTEYQWADNPPY